MTNVAIPNINLFLFQEDGILLSITSYLSGRQIQEACMLAIKNKDNYLALLLAQASGFSKTYKRFMQLQLQHYNQLVRIRFIHTF